MKRHFALFGAAGLGAILLSGCCGGKTDARLTGLETQVAELRQELAATSRAMADAQQAAAGAEESVKLKDLFEIYMNHHSVNPVLAKRYLATIELPREASQAETGEFLSTLYSLSRINSDEDFVNRMAAKITQVGKENIELLLPYINYRPFSRAFALLGGAEDKELLLRAIRRNQNQSELLNFYIEKVDRSDGKTVLEMLDQNPMLIKAVRKLGLVNEAMPIIRQKLFGSLSVNNSFNSELEWLTFALENLPKEEIPEFCERIWKNNKGGDRNNWSVISRALILARYGSLPAFKYLAQNVSRNYNQDQYNRTVALADCALDEFPEWYRKNADRLYFDAKDNLFKAEKPAAPIE